MTLDQLREALRKRIGKHSLRQWCAKQGVNSTHASEFLNGKRAPATDLLDALSLEWRIVRKRPAQGTEARRAETGTGSVHDGPVREANAPKEQQS